MARERATLAEPIEDDEEVEHRTERMDYWWTCGECGDTHETEYDLRGMMVECPTCGTKGRLRGEY